MRYELILQIRSGTALSIEGYSAPRPGLDASMAIRKEGLPVIPGSTIKGILRERAEVLAEELNNLMGGGDAPTCKSPSSESMCPNGSFFRDRGRYCFVCEMFGSPWLEGGLVFSDATLQPLPSSDEAEEIYETHKKNALMPPVRPMVAISRKMGRSKEECLRFIETTEPFQPLTFYSNITASLNFQGSGRLKFPAGLIILNAAVDTLTKIGGERCRGLGNCSASLLSHDSFDDLSFSEYCRNNLEEAFYYVCLGE